jgi:hypothetical protein
MKRQAFLGVLAGRKTQINAEQSIEGVVLSGGRCAARAKKRNFIQRSRKHRPRIVPAGNLGSGSNSAEKYRQRRSMQRLANVANRVRPAIVLVQQAAATRKIEQRQAQQGRAYAPKSLAARACAKQIHRFRLHHNTPILMR